MSNDLESLLRKIGTKHALLVEGKDDRDVIEQFLEKIDENWRSHIIVYPIGGGRSVYATLRQIFDDIAYEFYRHRVWGLIDGGDHTETQAAFAHTNKHLLILPRPEIENYFVAPQDLQQLVPDVFSLLGNEVMQGVERWIAQQAMVEALRNNNIDYFCKYTPPTDLAEIRTDLLQAIQRLNDVSIMRAYDTNRQSMAEFSLDELLRYHIHGKEIFRQVIVRWLDQAMLKEGYGRGSTFWMKKLASAYITCPDDLLPILTSVLPD